MKEYLRYLNILPNAEIVWIPSTPVLGKPQYGQSNERLARWNFKVSRFAPIFPELDPWPMLDSDFARREFYGNDNIHPMGKEGLFFRIFTDRLMDVIFSNEKSH